MKPILLPLLLAALPAQAGYYDDHPLTAADVTLYLQVMDKAAARAQAMRGHVRVCPKPPELKGNAMPSDGQMKAMTEAANCMARLASVTVVDDDVAQEMKVSDRFAAVKDGIEAVVQYDPSRPDGVGPGGMGAGGCGGDDCGPPHPTAAQKALWAHQDAIRKQNMAFVMPWRARIQKDQFLVRRLPDPGQ